jgi:acetoin utilization deacetylase AcuC-like enzyme
MLEHGISSHPENAERLRSVLKLLSESPYKDLVDLSCHRKATMDELQKNHSADYIKHVLSLEGQDVSLDSETILTKGSVEAALVAVGLGIELVERVIKGEAKNGFALLRPPGHHARPTAGMGFCVFNNIAIAARKALSMGIKRLLIFDFDVHHGNGTEESFYEDDRVLFIDLHQENLFPVNSGKLEDSGREKGLGYTLNIPLPEGCGDSDYLYTFDTVVRPIVLEYQPELILVSAGFDAHESDPLGFMNLTTPGYGQIASRIKALAQEVCDGKVVFFLEGGYNPNYLARNVLECIKVLSDEDHEKYRVPAECSQEIKQYLRRVHDHHVKTSQRTA